MDDPRHHDPTAGMSSVREPRRRDEEDMKFQIHCMEKEAYSSVLRAFVAQSDLLSWGKEGLLTDLRKELRVTDSEHGELLVKVNSDELIDMIRNRRRSALGVAPNSETWDSQKKKKASRSSVPNSQNHLSQVQSSSIPLLPPLPAQFRDNQSHHDEYMSLAGHSMKVFSHNIPESSKSKGCELVKSHAKKDVPAPDLINFKKRYDFIEIRATDKLIHEVKSAINGSRKNPDRVQIEKARLTLLEHERAILVALDKLADVLDKANPSNQMGQLYSHSHDELPRTGQRRAAHSDSHVQPGRFHGYPTSGFVQAPSVKVRIPSQGTRDHTKDPMTGPVSHQHLEVRYI